MTSRLRAGAAVLACLLMVFGAGLSLAHDGHKQRAQEASSERSEVEVASPAEEAVEATPHDHRAHDAAASVAPADAPLVRPASNLPKPLAWLGKLHPPVTHFPIALLTVAALAELLLIRTHKVMFRHAVLFCVRVGAGAAMLAAALGWFFAGVRMVDQEWLMTAHRWAGTATALLAGGLLFLLDRVERAERPAATRTRFRVALFSGAAVVGATGFLGGALVYGLDHYAW